VSPYFHLRFDARWGMDGGLIVATYSAGSKQGERRLL
jgi:hypothetical protein